MLDEHGYLFLGGRSDDTIIRGGENIAPAEIEDVLVEHARMHEVAVVGASTPSGVRDRRRWFRRGHRPGPDELREHVQRTAGSRTPDRVVFRDELPTNATGKVLRREIVSSLNQTADDDSP